MAVKTKSNINAVGLSVATVAAILSAVFFVPTTGAVNLTSASITATRLKVSTAAVHSVSFGGAPAAAQNEYIWLDYGDWTNLPGTSSPTCNWAGSTCTVSTSVSDVGIQCTQAGGCSAGTVTASGITITNQAAAGQMFVYISDDSFTQIGQVALYIVDDDSVTVTATVDPTITFDIDVATTNAQSDAPYAVSLGTVTTTDTRVSGTTDGVNYIFFDIATNATSGAIITVKNANGTNGLVSTSVGADTIQNNTGANVVDGTENYGLCVTGWGVVLGALAEGASYSALATCDANTEGNNVAALSSTTPDQIMTSSGAPVSGGRVQIMVQSSISSVTDAHDDYADTLTFIATGTF